MLIIAVDSRSIKPFWLWCYAIAVIVTIGYEIRSRKTLLGGLTVSHAESPILYALIIFLKTLGAGLLFWLFYE